MDPDGKRKILKKLWLSFKKEELIVVSLFIILMFFVSVNNLKEIKAEGEVPQLLKFINSTNRESDPSKLININGIIFFVADNGIYGNELWKTDGTVNGTVMVKDINPSAGSSLDYLANIGGVLYFQADDGTNGVELWKSDGTEAGTVMVKNINPSGDSYPSIFTEIGGTFYFRANDGTNSYELWKSDGTEGGTVMVKDINPSGMARFIIL